MPSLYSFQAPFPIQSLIVLNLFVSFVALIVIYTRLTVGEKLGEEAADLLFAFFAQTFTWPIAAVFGKASSSTLVFEVSVFSLWFVFGMLLWKPFRKVLTVPPSDKWPPF